VADSKDDARDARLSPFIRAVWVVLGLCGAVVHVMAGWTGKWPNADLITMAWLGFAALGLVLPGIESIDFPGGGGVKFRKAVEAGREGIAELQSTVRDATDLLQNWLTSLSWLNTYLQRADVDDEAAVKAVFRYCLERMEEAKDWMGDEDEAIRISLWWYDSESNELFFVQSNDIRDQATIDFRFAPNSGLMGQAFAENRIYNIENAPTSAFYIKIRDATPDYHGLMLVPVRVLDQAMGIISIDREKTSCFTDEAQNVAEALAEQISYAFMHPRSRVVIESIPDRVNALLLSWRAEEMLPEPGPTPSPSSGDSGRPQG
jgi:hypothetical protein